MPHEIQFDKIEVNFQGREA